MQGGHKEFSFEHSELMRQQRGEVECGNGWPQQWVRLRDRELSEQRGVNPGGLRRGQRAERSLKEEEHQARITEASVTVKLRRGGPVGRAELGNDW